MLRHRRSASIQEVTFEQVKLISKMTRWHTHPRLAIDPTGTLDLVLAALPLQLMVDLLRSYQRHINLIMRRCHKVFREALCPRWRYPAVENKLPRKTGNNILRFRGLTQVVPSLGLYIDRDQIWTGLSIETEAHQIPHLFHAQSERILCSSTMGHWKEKAPKQANESLSLTSKNKHKKTQKQRNLASSYRK